MQTATEQVRETLAIRMSGFPLIGSAAVEREQERQALRAESEAEERLWADAETFAQWLSVHCMYAKTEHCRIGHVPRDPAHLSNFVQSLDVPQLVALQLYPRAEASFAASMRLRDLYTAESACYLAKLVDQVSDELSFEA